MKRKNMKVSTRSEPPTKSSAANVRKKEDKKVLQSGKNWGQEGSAMNNEMPASSSEPSNGQTKGDESLPVVLSQTARVFPVRRSFAELLNVCRAVRTANGRMSARTSFSNFNASHHKDLDVTRLYCLGRTSTESTENTFLYVDLASSQGSPLGGQQADGSSDLRHVTWKPLYDSCDVLANQAISIEEELRRQRLRQLIGGVNSYDFDKQQSMLIYSSGSKVRVLRDLDVFEHPDCQVFDLSDIVSEGSSPMDVKFCLGTTDIFSFILNNDIYVHFNDTSLRITHTATGKQSPKSAGVASYIIQEEFDRLTGYWWSPNKRDGKLYILYEENDDSNVELMSINCPAEPADNIEFMRYPKPGKPNTQWNIRVAEILPTYKEDAVSIKNVEVNLLQCAFDLHAYFPWAEYVIRAGWTPLSTGVWLQLLSRLQRKLAIIYLPLDLFVLDPNSPSSKNFDPSKILVLYEEDTPDYIIKDHNYFTFTAPAQLDNSNNPVSFDFIWSSGKSGFSHLYRIHSAVNYSSPTAVDSSTTNRKSVTICKWEEIALTRGEFEISRKAEPYVDTNRGLIYFLANRDDPLEFHVFCLDYLHPSVGLRQLTESGYSHGLLQHQRAFYVHVGENCDASYLVVPRSNISTPSQCVVYRLIFSSSKDGETLPTASIAYFVSSNDKPVTTNPAILDAFSTSPTHLERTSKEFPPEMYKWRSKYDDKIHYGCLWRPINFNEQFLYPVVLYVYGGPEVQFVRNAYVGNMNLSRYTSLGYCVVIIDGRGSANRGMNFEKDIWGSMGTVELQDQVEGLQYISSESKCLDLDRVAITGWSYGGYMALMALAKQPSLFKVAIAGAPVSSWELYDTGYTERYLGLPPNSSPHSISSISSCTTTTTSSTTSIATTKIQQTADNENNFFSQDSTPSPHALSAYDISSVLTKVRLFPNEPGRLLLLHGMMDENVHFRHTSSLISALIKASKPYSLQIFPSERHAMGNFDSCVHVEATVLDFLQQNLQ